MSNQLVNFYQFYIELFVVNKVLWNKTVYISIVSGLFFTVDAVI